MNNAAIALKYLALSIHFSFITWLWLMRIQGFSVQPMPQVLCVCFPKTSPGLFAQKSLS